MLPNLLVRRVCSPQRIVAHRRQRMLHFPVFGWFKDEVFWEQRAGHEIDLANGQIEILAALTRRVYPSSLSGVRRVPKPSDTDRDLKPAGKLGLTRLLAAACSQSFDISALGAFSLLTGAA